MKESLIIEKLRNVDRELHSIMEELKPKKHRKALPLSELTMLMGEARISDEDSAELIRKMRDREYDA